MTTLFNLPTEIKSFQADHSWNADFDKIRLDALQRLESNELPTRRTESWKYTNLKKVFESELTFKNQQSSFDISKLKSKNYTSLFFINGSLSDLSDKCELSISPLNDKSLEIIKKNSHGLVNDFAFNLNESTLHDGAHFELADNVNLSKPIIIYHISDGEKETIRTHSNTFSIGKNSKLEIMEVYISNNTSNSVTNFASNIEVKQNSKFVHIHHQVLDNNITFFNNIRSQVARDAAYESITTTVGSQLSRNNIHIDLNEEGANCMAHGVYTLQKEQHSDINSFINHKAPHTNSAQLYKGIMSGKSRGVFTGLIKVDKDAQLINSAQLNKNLLLTKNAQANSRPQLEIFADDVKCSHGSTTGQLNEDELFYFESRGIRPKKARMILSHAFTYDVVLKVENPVLRKIIQDDIFEKFEKTAFED